VTQLIASKTNGTHHAVGRLATQKEIVENMLENLKEDQQMVGIESFSN
jgi:hypothetical protein